MNTTDVSSTLLTHSTTPVYTTYTTESTFESTFEETTYTTDFNATSIPPDNSPDLGLIIGLSVGIPCGVALIVALIVTIVYLRKKRKKIQQNKIENPTSADSVYAKTISIPRVSGVTKTYDDVGAPSREPIYQNTMTSRNSVYDTRLPASLTS